MPAKTKEEIKERLEKVKILYEFPEFWQNRVAKDFFAVATDKGKEDLENKAREGFLEGISKEELSVFPEQIYIPQHLIKTIKVEGKTVHYAVAAGIYS